MSITTRNENAERLLADYPIILVPLTEALAFERRATVERIGARIRALSTWDKRTVPGGLHVMRSTVLAILDEEAQR